MPNDNFFERHSKIFVTLIIIIIVVGMDLLFGSAYQMISGQPWSQAAMNRNIIGERAYRIPSDHYDHDLLPNVNLQGYWGIGRYQFATDSLGFKNSTPQEIALESEKHRILLIGDSFTEGVGIPYKDTFAGLIADEFSHRDIEVLNAGVVSYYPKIYYRKIKYLIENVQLKFDEVFVYLDVSDATDGLGAYYYIDDSGKITGRKPSDQTKKEGSVTKSKDKDNLFSGFLKNNSILFHYIYQVFIRNIEDEVKGVFVSAEHGKLNRVKSLWTVSPELFEQYGEESLDLMEENMDLLRKLLDEHDISLSVAVYPWPDQIVHNDLKSKYVQHWQGWCRKYNINFLDHFPDFIQENNTKDDHRRIFSQYFIKGDVHWNREGHQLIADRFITSYSN